MMNDEPLWSLLEQAWSLMPLDVRSARTYLETRRTRSNSPPIPLDEALFTLVDYALPDLHQHLKDLTSTLTQREVAQLDHIVERKLYDIDRQDVHEEVDGSDDGFLYARGFIVVLGKEYYNKVKEDPVGVAVMDSGDEEFCYFFSRLHHERFGSYPDKMEGSVCRETGSNTAGWS